jgi:hypothetical protein
MGKSNGPNMTEQGNALVGTNKYEETKERKCKTAGLRMATANLLSLRRVSAPRAGFFLVEGQPRGHNNGYQ